MKATLYTLCPLCDTEGITILLLLLLSLYSHAGCRNKHAYQSLVGENPSTPALLPPEFALLRQLSSRRLINLRLRLISASDDFTVYLLRMFCVTVQQRPSLVKKDQTCNHLMDLNFQCIRTQLYFTTLILIML